VVGLPIFFTDETFVLDFTSIGTLFAFVLVCGGVLLLSPQSAEEVAEAKTKSKFRIPYINAKFIFPLIIVGTAVIVHFAFPDFFSSTFDFSGDITANITMVIFFLLCVVMAVLAFLKNLSLIPLLGLVSCCYLLTGMALSNWMWFGAWLLLGLVFYFAYGRSHSKLNGPKTV
jgi:hypothetical protein